MRAYLGRSGRISQALQLRKLKLQKIQRNRQRCRAFFFDGKNMHRKTTSFDQGGYGPNYRLVVA